MNGSENGYAGAIFFALMTLGALLKLDDTNGLIVGAVGALLAAISLRRALIKSAQAAEEDHQRIEIQFQQLRNKIIETSESTATAMESVNVAAQLVQENMQVLAVRLEDLNKLTGLIENLATIDESINALAKTVESVNTNIVSLDENSSALNAEVEKFFVALQERDNSAAVTDELKNIVEIEDANRTNLQAILKFLQLVEQAVKTPIHADLLEKILTSTKTLNLNLVELLKLNDGKSTEKILAAIKNLNANLAEIVKRNDGKSIEKILAAIENLNANLAEIDKRTDDKSAALDEKDISLLKKIVAKISLK